MKAAVVGDPGAADRFGAALEAAAAARGCQYVALDADAVKLQLVDQLFFAVSRLVDWDELAAASVRAAYDAAAFPVPPGADLTVAAVASHHDVDTRELYRSVRRQLEQRLLGDTALAPEMRRAMVRLAQVRLGAGDVDRAEHEAVLGWLRGDLKASRRCARP